LSLPVMLSLFFFASLTPTLPLPLAQASLPQGRLFQPS
jgi:hypothetical protein